MEMPTYSLDAINAFLEPKKEKRKVSKRITKRTHRRVNEGPGLVLAMLVINCFVCCFFVLLYEITIYENRLSILLPKEVNVLCADLGTRLLLVFMKRILKCTLETRKITLKNTTIKTINRNLETVPKIL